MSQPNFSVGLCVVLKLGILLFFRIIDIGDHCTSTLSASLPVCWDLAFGQDSPDINLSRFVLIFQEIGAEAENCLALNFTGRLEGMWYEAKGSWQKAEKLYSDLLTDHPSDTVSSYPCLTYVLIYMRICREEQVEELCKNC